MVTTDYPDEPPWVEVTEDLENAGIGIIMLGFFTHGNIIMIVRNPLNFLMFRARSYLHFYIHICYDTNVLYIRTIFRGSSAGRATRC